MPPGQLLEFHVQEEAKDPDAAWAKLASFVGKPAPPKGTPLPHPRSRRSWTNDAMWDYASLATRSAVVGIFLGLHLLNFVIARTLWRVARRLWLGVRSRGFSGKLGSDGKER